MAVFKNNDGTQCNAVYQYSDIEDVDAENGEIQMKLFDISCAGSCDNVGDFLFDGCSLDQEKDVFFKVQQSGKYLKISNSNNVVVSRVCPSQGPVEHTYKRKF